MKDLLSKIKTSLDSDDYKIGTEASESKIEETELYLNLRFPIKYKEFLKTFGWLEINNTYFFGVSESITSEGSVAKMTSYARENWNLPHSYLVLYSSEDKILWCVDCSSPKDQVISYNTTTKKTETIIAPNYEIMLSSYLDM